MNWVYSEGEVQFSSVQSLNRVRLFATPLNAARQASLMCIKGRNCKNNILMVSPPLAPGIRIWGEVLVSLATYVRSLSFYSPWLYFCNGALMKMKIGDLMP